MEDKIQSILNRFNFRRVRWLMERIPGEWLTAISKTDCCGAYFTPSIDDLKEFAKTLLEKAASSTEDKAYLASGGFRAIKWNNRLELTFELDVTRAD